eukprot:comp18069_c0_seq1/m.18656 comp18069_c0_seq1/g.18656  ORF comp18069_c0_seq1/g.18656 comp18069_c0_seq1/m.18656 type:complete len:457 (-) comp18069_c0_seq1:864-2234(-)
MAAVMDSDKGPVLPGSSKMKQLEEVCPWEVENVCPWDFQKKEETAPAPPNPAPLVQQTTNGAPSTSGRMALFTEPSKPKGPERGVAQGVPEDMAKTAGAAKVDQAISKLRVKKNDTGTASACSSSNALRKEDEKFSPKSSADAEIAPWETQTSPTGKVVVETQKLGTGGKVAEIAPWEVEKSLPEAAVAVTVQKLGKTTTNADIAPWEDPTVGGSGDKVEITVQRLVTVEEVTPWEVGTPGNSAGVVEINVQSLKEFVDPEVATGNRRASTDKNRRTSTQLNTLERKDTTKEKEKEQRRSSQGLSDSNRRGSITDVFGRRKSHDSKAPGEKSPLPSNSGSHEDTTKVASMADAEISPWEYQSKEDVAPVQIKTEAIGQAIKQVEEVTPWEMPAAKPGLATVQVEVIGGKSGGASDDVCPWEMTEPAPAPTPATNQVHPTQTHGSSHHGPKLFGKRK